MEDKSLIERWTIYTPSCGHEYVIKEGEKIDLSLPPKCKVCGGEWEEAVKMARSVNAGTKAKYVLKEVHLNLTIKVLRYPE